MDVIFDGSDLNSLLNGEAIVFLMDGSEDYVRISLTPNAVSNAKNLKYDAKDLRKYAIDCGFGIAYLTTPYEPTERFPILANTCFGLRKSWMCCDILSVEIVDEDDYEHLWWNGDEYIWRKDGARKMISPFPDEEWQTDYCEKCRKE